MQPILPPGWRREKRRIDDEFVRRVMRLWDQAQNTADIADRLGEFEFVVHRAIRVGLEARRGAA